MRPRLGLVYFLSTLVLILLFQNCSKQGLVLQEISAPDVVPHSEELPSESPQEPPTEPPPKAPDEMPLPPQLPSPPNQMPDLISDCKEAKDRGKIQFIRSEVLFEDPGRGCSFGQNGNLAPRNDSLTARAEQIRSVPIPADYKVCNIELINVDQQNFRYDDNILITMNQYILASTTNFTRHLESKNGYFKYDWTRLRGKDAQARSDDSTPGKQYCPGKSTGKAMCLFPQTDTVGSIQLRFDERIIQEILTLTSPNKIDLGMITTGDDNSSDCRHVPLRFAIKIDYYQ